jgi:membrane associated rhomboid family serine protease
MTRRLETCPRCRAFHEPGISTCPYCGAPLRVRRRGVRGALVKTYLQAPASYSLLLLILLLFSAELWMEGAIGGPAGPMGALLNPSPLTLVRLGANIGPLNVDGGEGWRFMTAVFLHIGLIHLAFNGWALIVLAPFCERVFGPARFLTVYLLTGLAGNIISYLWHVERGGQLWLQAGASGALCGLLGLLMVFRSGRGWDAGSDAIRRITTRWLLLTVLFGLFAGADNAAHLGGAAVGAALGLLLNVRSVRSGRAWTRWGWRPAAAVCSLLALLSIGAMVASQSTWREAERMLETVDDLDRLQKSIRSVEVDGKMPASSGALDQALLLFAERPLSDAELAGPRDAVVRAVRTWSAGNAPPTAQGILRKTLRRYEELVVERIQRDPIRIGLLQAAREASP